jgi:hypothetical protein
VKNSYFYVKDALTNYEFYQKINENLRWIIILISFFFSDQERGFYGDLSGGNGTDQIDVSRASTHV